MFVKRWGILRMAMPVGITIDKTIALVNALARIHNFCISNEDEGKSIDFEILPIDENHIVNNPNGYITLVAPPNGNERDVIPSELLGHGHHFKGQRSEIWKQKTVGNRPLPRKIMHNLVLKSNHKCPRYNRKRRAAEISV